MAIMKWRIMNESNEWIMKKWRIIMKWWNNNEGVIMWKW